MTSEDLRAWQAHMGISGREAARRLGVAPGTYQDWVTATSRTTRKPNQISRLVALACAAQAAGVGEWAAEDSLTPKICLTAFGCSYRK
jgi:transposase